MLISTSQKVVQYVDTRRHFCDITLDRYCIKLESIPVKERRYQSSVLLSWLKLISVPVTASVTTLLWTTAANGKHGTVSSSHTVTVLLHLFADVVPHHSGVFLQLVQLHALLLHPLLVILELLLQFCNHKFNLVLNQRKCGTFWIVSTLQSKFFCFTVSL